MPWGRVGDDAWTYPKLLAVAGIPGAPDCAVNEVFGFFQGCILQSAGHVTDYVVNKGAVQSAGRARWRKVLAWSERVGLLTPVLIDGMEHWTLHDDPKFIHIRTQAELDAEKFTKDMRGKPHIAVEVLLRDGDQCRYCGIHVLYDGQKSNRSLTFDHLVPGRPAETPDDVVVCCRRHNNMRQDNRNGFDAINPLRPPPRPADRMFSKNTAAYLTKNGHPTKPNTEPDASHPSSIDAPQQPTQAAQDDEARPAPSWIDSDEDGPADAAETGARVTQDSESPGVQRSTGTTLAGSGRDGESAAGGEPPPRKRKKRGKRGGGGGRGAPTPVGEPAPCCAVPHLQPDPDTGIKVCLTCEKEPTS